jgi:hypothetical protein
MSFRGAIVLLGLLGGVACAVAGCGGDEVHALDSGNYSLTVLSVTEDQCQVSQPAGTVDSNYGAVTVAPAQVVHTNQQTFSSEIYERSGNTLTRTVVSDSSPMAGGCVVTTRIEEDGTVTANDTIELTHIEVRSVKTGDCSGVNVPCRSSFSVRLVKL